MSVNISEAKAALNFVINYTYQEEKGVGKSMKEDLVTVVSLVNAQLIHFHVSTLMPEYSEHSSFSSHQQPEFVAIDFGEYCLIFARIYTDGQAQQ